MSDLRIISILAIVALAAITWVAVRALLFGPINALQTETTRRTADLREHREKNTAALAVWAYVADEHALDGVTGRCACGGVYLTCPGRAALHAYAMHLLGKSPVSSATPDVIVSGGTAYIAG